MREGIINNQKEDVIADFLIDEAYASDILPISCILTGSRAYGIDVPDSDRDYVGIHLMDTWQCLEHPSFRSNLQVVRKRYTQELEEIPDGIKGGSISLDSFEMWKFISLLLKGSIVTYEILYMPEIHHGYGSDGIITLCREGLTNKIGRAAKGMLYHDRRKNKTSRKKTVMAYYRLIQAIHFLREGEFEWNAHQLWEYINANENIPTGKEILGKYIIEETRKEKLDEKELERAALELEKLVDEVDKSMVITKFPDQMPKKVLQNILKLVKESRGKII